MKISFLFSSPAGDILLTDGDNKQPFLIEAGLAHPFITLGDYFNGLVDFVNAGESELCELFGVAKDIIDELVFRSEKHGVLYHIASVEIVFGNRIEKFAISSAITEEGKCCLDRDFVTMQELALGKESSPFPQQYFKKHIIVGKGKEKVSFMMTLSEWLEDYHEWHLALKKEGGEQIQVWDNRSGSYYLDPKQEAQLFYKTSLVLSEYFEPISSRQIYPWHHAAGDFIVKKTDNNIDVRLITVRNYQALFEITAEHEASPLVSYIMFFVHLTIRMRLDRMHGVDQMVWLGAQVVEAVVNGFVDACYQKKGKAKVLSDSLLAVLPTFGPDELETVCQHLLELYKEESIQDYQLICANLEEHLHVVAGEVKRVLR